jgi:hypothetical protein
MLFAAALAATIPSLYAQAPKGEGRARFDCSQTKDPKACEERRDKMKATFTQAEKACEGKQGPERRECMMKQMCAQQQDPKACEERMAKMKDNMGGARAACEGKEGRERRECMMKQACAQQKDPAQCEAMARQRMAEREEMLEKMEACKDKQGEERRACVRAQMGQK